MVLIEEIGVFFKFGFFGEVVGNWVIKGWWWVVLGEFLRVRGVVGDNGEDGVKCEELEGL